MWLSRAVAYHRCNSTTSTTMIAPTHFRKLTDRMSYRISKRHQKLPQLIGIIAIVIVVMLIV